MHDDLAVYRKRVYDAYLTGRSEAIAPTTLAGLKPRLPYLRRLVRKCMPSNRDAAILDIGCGHGALIYALNEAGYRNLRGTDGSPEQVKAAARLGIEGIELADLRETLRNVPDSSLDVLIAFDLIEHFTKSELVSLTDEAYRVLKPNGRWIIHVPNAESPFGMRVRYGDFTHELAFTRTSLAQMLFVSGFTQVRCFEDQPIPHGLKSMVRAVIWQIIRTSLMIYVMVETGTIDRGAIYSQNLLAVAHKL